MECLQRCGLGEQGVRPSPHIRHRRDNWRLAVFGSLLPGSASHPVVNESLGGGVLVSGVKGDACVGYYGADSFSLVRRGRLRIEQREQRWLVEGHCAYTT